MPNDAPTTPTEPPASPPTPSFGTISGFTLVNAGSNLDIGPLDTGDTVDLALVGTQLSVRADYTGSIGSVGFSLDGDANYQTENFAVYALGGDISGNYNVVSELGNTGSHTVTATPYSGANKSGDAGTAVSITFTVV